MTIQLAILGNSHAGALALAWDDIKDRFPQFDITFFAAPGRNFRRLQINEDKIFGILDGSLFAPEEIALLKSTFGASRIALDGFDAVLSVGHDTLETELAGLISAFTIDGLRRAPRQPHLSQTAYEALADGLAQKSLLPEHWQGWTTPKLFLLPAPRIAESCKTAKKGVYAPWAKILVRAETYPANHLFDDYVNRVIDVYQTAGIEVLMPPEEVLAPNGLTKAEYSEGSVTLNTLCAHPTTDHKHMNKAYGMVVFPHILDTIAKNFVTDEPDVPETEAQS